MRIQIRPSLVILMTITLWKNSRQRNKNSNNKMNMTHLRPCSHQRCKWVLGKIIKILSLTSMIHLTISPFYMTLWMVTSVCQNHLRPKSNKIKYLSSRWILPNQEIYLSYGRVHWTYLVKWTRDLNSVSHFILVRISRSFIRFLIGQLRIMKTRKMPYNWKVQQVRE